MKKQAFALILFLALLISTVVGIMHCGTVQAVTNVNGIISSDTIWTKANSPYSLTGPVGVADGVNLTIEAGVTVNLNSYYIQVNGTLSATGSSADKIYINDGSDGVDGRGYPIYPITFTPFSTDWNEQNETGCIIENAVLSSTSVFISASPKIYLNSFTDSFIWVSSSWSGSGAEAFDASPIISNNTLNGSGGSYGIGTFYSDALIVNNNISGYSAGIDMRSDTSTIVEGNLIVDNVQGIQLVVHQGPVSPTIRNNTITDNSNGISLLRQFTAPTSPLILYNNIYANTNYNINSNVPDDINATFNWWGTTDTEAINQTIHDYYEDFNLGTVDFTPFLSELNPEAPIIPEFSTLIAILSVIVLSTFALFFGGKARLRNKPSFRNS